jgi:hypothetical protein
VKQIAHRVDEDAARFFPELRLLEPLLASIDIAEYLLPPMRVSQAGIPLTQRKPINEETAVALAHVGRAAIKRHGGAFIDWVSAGGESGPQARPMHPDWVRSLRDQCVAAGVPFFFKQWGEWAVADGRFYFQKRYTSIDGCRMAWVGKTIAGAMLDGREWREYPQGE